MRLILLVHRYLAVAVGLLMTLWCLSGFVMMYQAMPELSSQQRLNGLQPLALTECCDLGSFAPHDSTPLGNFRIEMLLGNPVLRATLGPQTEVISLRTGDVMPALSPEQVLSVAQMHGAGNRIAGTAAALGTIVMDQWTIQSAPRNQPAWHIGFNDPAGTEIYINGRTGEIFQQTNRRERTLAWLGAIPHWLYPTVLRQNPALWTAVVVWASILGTFLAATGLYVGITRLRQQRGRDKNKPSYSGWWQWHHLSGLIFGVLVLTWVFSGLMTMNPWGALSSAGGLNYRPQLQGNAQWSELKQFLAAIEGANADVALATDLVQITPAVFNHQLFLMATPVQGEPVRLDRRGQPSPLETTELEQAIARLDAPVTSALLMHTEDLYYYGHKTEVPLPVFRVIMDDSEQTRIYINTNTGVVRSLGNSGRWSRWIRSGLHNLDFPILRQRPLWDIVVIMLLSGVTLVCATGTWMAIRRVRRFATKTSHSFTTQ